MTDAFRRRLTLADEYSQTLYRYRLQNYISLRFSGGMDMQNDARLNFYGESVCWRRLGPLRSHLHQTLDPVCVSLVCGSKS